MGHKPVELKLLTMLFGEKLCKNAYEVNFVMSYIVIGLPGFNNIPIIVLKDTLHLALNGPCYLRAAYHEYNGEEITVKQCHYLQHKILRKKKHESPDYPSRAV